MTRTPVATDDFNRASLDSDWAQLYSFWGSVVIDTNQVRGTSSDVTQMAAVRWVGAGSFTDDQYAVLELTDISFAGGGIGVIARASGDTDANRDFYFFRYNVVAGVTELGKIVDGTETVLDTPSVTWSTNDTIEIECEGTTIRGLKNGSVVSTETDSALTTGAPGICAFQGANLPLGDNWIGGNFTAGGASVELVPNPTLGMHHLPGTEYNLRRLAHPIGVSPAVIIPGPYIHVLPQRNIRHSGRY